MQYDAIGNLTYDGREYFQYDAAGKQSYASTTALSQSYDGDGLRVKKVEYGSTTYYLRSSVLSGQVMAEINGGGGWARGYVYLGQQLIAIQDGAVVWVHLDPITKSQRLTDTSGNIVSGVELDPWGGETNRSWNQTRQPHAYTTYTRDGNMTDDAQARKYHVWWSRFDQPDPTDSSYNLADPQSFNRYSYVQNDPVNFVDPSGLLPISPVGCEAGHICFNINIGDGSRVVDFGAYLGFGGYTPHDRPAPNTTDPPQTVPVQNLRGNVQKLLDKGDCAATVQKLLDTAAGLFPKNSPHAGSIMEVFDRVSSPGQGGFQVGLPAGATHYGGTVTGDLFAYGARPGTVYLSPFYSSGSRYAAAQAQDRYSFTALHELFHLAGKGGFDDAQMGQAVFAITGNKMGLPPAGSTSVTAWSAYWDAYLHDHCSPSRR